MPLDEREVALALAERQDANKVMDRWNGLRTYYRDWQEDYEALHRIYRNDWTMTWPDNRVEAVDPSVPNMIRLAAEDRARSVASSPPQLLCPPDGPGDDAREAANKLERIGQAWLNKNRITGYTTQRWAMDGMGGGLLVAKVLPDFNETDRSKRFPCITRLEPQLSYPDPVFAPGPFLDSFMYSYEEYRRNVEARYGLKLSWKEPRETSAEKVTVIEYYDEKWIHIVVQAKATDQASPNQKVPRETVFLERHRMSKCPVVVSAAAKMDGTYDGEFSGGVGVLEYWNKLMTMVMDDAIHKVYPERLAYNVIGANDYGPDALITKETPDGEYGYVQQPNQPFTNGQLLRDVGASVRTSFIMPPSRSGDPNESIISAAGVNANTTQFMEDVRAIQRDLLAPLLEAALEVAAESEEVWSADVTKNIFSDGTRYRETYVPSEDIDGYRRFKLTYGPMPGLDPINQGVMVMQALGAGIIDVVTAMELSPFVEDPRRVEKRKLKDQITQAMLASLQQAAINGQLSPYILAVIDQAIDSDEVSLSEAVAVLLPQQLPAPTAPGAGPTAPTTPAEAQQTPQAPGVAGAAEGPLPQNTAAGQAAA